MMACFIVYLFSLETYETKISALKAPLAHHKVEKLQIIALISSLNRCIFPSSWSLPFLNKLLPLSQPLLSLDRPSRTWTAWSVLCGRQRWVTTPFFAAASSYRAVEMEMCCCRMPGLSTVTCLRPAASSLSWRSSSRNNPRPRPDSIKTCISGLWSLETFSVTAEAVSS